jgi:rhodanese-related sulfurtransferase
VKEMNKQRQYYLDKLAYETDSADLFAGLKNGEKIRVIDARKKEAYVTEHIPGAINIWHGEMTEESTKDLDVTFLYVIYCDGIGCNASTKGALQICKLGFQVKELIGGLDWWKRDGYATAGKRSQEGTEISCGC